MILDGEPPRLAESPAADLSRTRAPNVVVAVVAPSHGRLDSRRRTSRLPARHISNVDVEPPHTTSRNQPYRRVVMSFRRRLKGKAPPEGFEMIEQAIEDFENQMKDAVNEEHEGKRKNELTWRIHRIHWEKNRFIFDLMYKRKALKRELYDYLCREKIADQALISKWRKPGYENLCSLLSIQKSATNFGTTSICRVPMASRAPQQRLTPNVKTGCISCCSGDGIMGGPIWWNTPITDDIEKKLNKKRKAEDAADAAEEDPEVAKRIAALKKEMMGGEGKVSAPLD